MTFWAKLLIVITLVLSVAFAAASAVLFAKQTNYRGLLKQEQQAAAAKEQKLNKDILRLEGDLQAQHETAVSLQAQLGNREIELDKAKQTEADLQKRILSLSVEKDALVAATNKLAESNKSLAEAEKDLLDRYNGILAESEKYRGELVAARAKIADLETAVTALTNQRDDLKVELADANQVIRETEAILDELASRDIEVRTTIAAMRITPPIKTLVSSVDMEHGILGLNAGAEKGVKKNYEFTIFRDNEFVATARVFHVEDYFSAARIETRAADIQLGDKAWTRLPQ